MIPYSRQNISEEEINEVVDALRSDFITSGPKVEAFENAVAEYCGSRYAVAVANGTAALHMAVMASGIKPGDEGITSPNTFLASANCIAFCNGVPRFADINSETYCIDPNKIREAIKPRTRVIIPAHFAGQPCEMDTIWDIAIEKGIFVIEDAAHAIGASWKDWEGKWRKVGACSHSHITIFSFHPVKTITTGEGGMILTNDESLAQRCRRLKNHGIERNPEKFFRPPISAPFVKTKKYSPWYYEMQELGYNYRITDLQAALGLVQMRRLDAFVAKRRQIWQHYNSELSKLDGFQTPNEKEGVHSAWHLYVAQVEQRDELLFFLCKNGIGAHAMYIPIHLQPYYQKQYGCKQGDFPHAEAYFKKCLVLPLFPGLKHTEIEYIINMVRSFYGIEVQI